MFNQIIILAGIHMLAVMSPGPDFAMVMRNSLIYSRKTGLLAAAGLAIGIIFHVTYSLLGIGLIISQSIVIFNIIKWIGAVYLIYIGIKSLLSKKQAKDTSAKSEGLVEQKQDLTTFQALRMGFLTNALNPKATLYFLAVFTTIIETNTPIIYKAVYGVEMVVLTFLWFAFVAVVLSHNKVSLVFAKAKHRIEKVFGVVLIALGLKVAFGSSK